MARRALALFVLVAGCSGSSGNGGNSGERPLAVIADPFRTVAAGASVTLSAADSYDPDNAAPAFPHGIDEFHWTLVSPSNSTAALVTATDGTATFIADVAGMFGGELYVEDQDENESEPVAFGITAQPIDPEADGLYAQLTWGAGPADLDLHLVYEGGTFAQAPLDCFYGNALTDWGCEHEFDATDGPGPEYLRLREPEAAVEYLVLAHINNGEGMPQAATVTIAFDGITVTERNRGGLQQDILWEVGTLAFASSNQAPVFTLTDTTYPAP